MDNLPISFKQRKANFWKIYCIFIIGYLVGLLFLNYSWNQKPNLSLLALCCIVTACLGSSLYNYVFGYQKSLRKAKQEPTLEKKIGKWGFAKILLLQSLFILGFGFFFTYQYFQNLYYLIPTVLILIVSIKIPMSWDNAPDILEFTREEYKEWQNLN